MAWNAYFVITNSKTFKRFKGSESGNIQDMGMMAVYIVDACYDLETRWRAERSGAGGGVEEVTRIRDENTSLY